LQSRFFRTSLIEGLHNGAKILLAHFHYYTKGNHPFAMDWSSPRGIARADLNAEQVQFMKETVELVKMRCKSVKTCFFNVAKLTFFPQKADKLQNVRRNCQYENDLYFLAQLFDRDWKPEHTI
jgi:hypothetical protein